jgi:hypothetical protein
MQGTILEIPRTDERYALPPSLNDQLEGALRGFEGFVCFFLGKICLGKDSIDTRSHPLVLLAESKRLMETGEGFVKVVSIQESCPKFDKSFPFFSVSADSAGTSPEPSGGIELIAHIELNPDMCSPTIVPSYIGQSDPQD